MAVKKTSPLGQRQLVTQKGHCGGSISACLWAHFWAWAPQLSTAQGSTGGVGSLWRTLNVTRYTGPHGASLNYSSH